VFGISLEELIVLAVLAFILFGPQKLPEYAATLGKFVAKIRQAGMEVTQQYQNPFQEPPKPEPASKKETDCPHCWGRVSPDFVFCPRCGHRLKEDHYAAASPSPESPSSPLAS
jgi:Sec-independent protein translocase protein TatA